MKKIIFLIYLSVFILVFFSCNPWIHPSHESIVMSGLVTNGNLYSNGTVYIKDARGKAVSTIIDETGHYSISIEGMEPPFILLAKDEQGNHPIYSGNPGFGTANITTFSNTIIALAFNDLPDDIFPKDQVIKNDYLLSKLPSVEVFDFVLSSVKNTFQIIFRSFFEKNTDLLFGNIDEQVQRINLILNIIQIKLECVLSEIEPGTRDLIVTMIFEENSVLSFKINSNDFEDEKIAILNGAAVDFQKSKYYKAIFSALGLEIEENYLITGTVSTGKCGLSGNVYLKDKNGSTLKTKINSDGKFSFDSENILPPFIIVAEYEKIIAGRSRGAGKFEYLYSGYYKNNGIVNITPATNTLIALSLLDIPQFHYRLADIINNGTLINDLPNMRDLEVSNKILYAIFSDLIGKSDYNFIYSEFDCEDKLINKFFSLVRHEFKVVDRDFIINFYYKDENDKFFGIVIPRNATNEEKFQIVSEEIEKSDTLVNKKVYIKEALKN